MRNLRLLELSDFQGIGAGKKAVAVCPGLGAGRQDVPALSSYLSGHSLRSLWVEGVRGGRG